MSRRQYEIGETALLEHYPADGPGTTPSCAIYGPSGELLGSPTATAESASQTVTATRALREVTGTITGFVVGRRYWLSTAGGGYGYADRIEDLATGKIYLASPARRDYTAGLLRGLRISASFTAPASPMRNCRLVWRYTQAGAAKMITEMVDFVRMPFELGLSPQVIEEISGTLPADLGTSGDWDGIIERAGREAFAWLAGKGLRPELVIDRQGLTSAFAWRVLALRYVGTTDDRYDRYQAEHDRALESYSQSRGWYDSSDTLSAGSSNSSELKPPSAPPQRARIA